MADYKQAGVDIDAGEALVHRIKPYVAETRTAGSLGKLGAFGGFFRADFGKLKEPVLVASVDGVGTKLKIAHTSGVHHTVGQCLVNHCVDDILACGARPLFFLDYYATGRLDVDAASEVIRGFTIACRENGCALIGGETAEMPGLYNGDEYDLSGTIVGVVDREAIIDGSRIEEGDTLLALPSTGLHTNGYSLARHVLLGENALPLEYEVEPGVSLRDALLAVHRSYLKPVTGLLDAGVEIRGISHITGGGIFGNTKRVLPEGLWIEIDEAAWQWPALFRLLQERGAISHDEMFRAFNLGIGMILILSPTQAEVARTKLAEAGERVIELGRVIRRA